MSVLESVLFAANAESTVPKFKMHGIEAFTLKLLNSEDLQLIGIDQEETRNSILEHANHLQIPSEKLIEVDVTSKYINNVIAQSSVHLLKHIAVLSIAVSRDVTICAVNLSQATYTFENCLQSLEDQLVLFENKIAVRQKRSKKFEKLPLIAVIAGPLVTGIVCATCFCYFSRATV